QPLGRLPCTTRFRSEKAREFDDIYQRLDEVWGHFIRLTSVKKAMSLEDFLDQMRIIVDKFGNVVGITTREAGLRGGVYNKEAAVDRKSTRLNSSHVK